MGNTNFLDGFYKHAIKIKTIAEALSKRVAKTNPKDPFVKKLIEIHAPNAGVKYTNLSHTRKDDLRGVVKWIQNLHPKK